MSRAWNWTIGIVTSFALASVLAGCVAHDHQRDADEGATPGLAAGHDATAEPAAPTTDDRARRRASDDAASPSKRVAAGGRRIGAEEALEGLATPAWEPSGPADELWVIESDASSKSVDRSLARSPVSGALLAVEARGTTPFSLESTEVRARIAGRIADVFVEQHFRNPFDEPIDAIYAFPLPRDASLDGFVLRIGSRRIRAVLRERTVARSIWDAARARGYRASLIALDRLGAFTQRIANIEPHKRIDVELHYADVLDWASDAWRFVLPLTVDALANPPAGSGAVKSTLTRSGQDVRLSIEIDAFAPLGDVASPSHDIRVDRTGASTATVSLATESTIANRDFVLRYRPGTPLRSTARVETAAPAGGGWLDLIVVPPEPQKPTEEVLQPMMTDVRIDAPGIAFDDALGARRAAIVCGQPATWLERFDGPVPEKLRVTGRIGTERVAFDVPVVAMKNRTVGPRRRPLLRGLWATRRVAVLAASASIERGEIVRFALEHGVASRHTSFIAVDATAPVDRR